MKTLWTPVEYCRPFDTDEDSIFSTCGTGMVEYLPYRRNYGDLSAEALQELIRSARENHWQALDLTNCGLHELPDELWDLPDLQMLFLGNRDWTYGVKGNPNQFDQLPRKIEALRNLRVLYLRTLSLTPEGDTPLRLDKLVHLDLYNCAYPEFPAAFLIPSLTDIGISGLQRPLPRAFSQLTQLRHLTLDYCRNTVLPDWIGSLSNLLTLSLRSSDVTELPPSILNLKKLWRLHLVNTPLEKMVPPEISRQSVQEILRYLLSLQGNAPKMYFNESKMIIVGQAQVGKSSLLERLVYESYSDKPSTEGIRIEPWTFERDGEEYRLNLWDFGGQEIYHATHQFFLTRRSLYILVWDALSEDEYGRIDYWLRTIQSFADDSPILIVVNKCDDDNGRRKKIYLEDYQKRYPQIHAIYEVSCKDNVGIDKLRTDIQDIAVQLPLMKTPWFTPWLNARKKLEALAKRKNHIPYEDYQSICEGEGVDPEDVLTLAKYLHDLGVILYYHDDMLLKDMVILSSEWGTDAVYKILDQQQRQLKDRNGILYAKKDLKVIWDDLKRYPPKYYQHLLNLMENFQLSFLVDKDTYLVAELLEEKAIELPLAFEHGQTLSFRYDYDFMPAGVMTRFIVLTHEHLDTIHGMKQCWKKGAYLRLDTAYARVELNDAPPNRHILVRVSGPDPRKRQELLTLIRQNLDKVNSLFRKISITRKIPCICRPDCPTFFEYEDLLRAEQKGKQTVECQKSWENVDLRKLLDGVENMMISDPEKLFSINIQNTNTFKPINTVTAKASNDTDVTTTVSVSVEIQNSIDSLYGELNALRFHADGALAEECDKIKKALDDLDKCQTTKDIKRSGVMEMLKNFLSECHDPETDTGKLIAGTKYAAKGLLDLMKKYNKLASLLGTPSIPLIGT